MRVFAPANSSQDSVYLLYKLLTETDDEIITRCIAMDSVEYELKQYGFVCEWLSSNIRKFDFGVCINVHPRIDGLGRSLPSSTDKVTIEGNSWHSTLHTHFDYNYAMEANKHKPDKFAIGFNTNNWHPSNWFFHANEKVEEFYRKDNPWVAGRHGVFTDYISIPIEWTLMNENFCAGRYEIWELIPEELQKIVARCSCGYCTKCASQKWYALMKSEGKTAVEIDDLIMKEGKYGKYFTKESTVDNRHAAYINMI